MLSFLRFLTFPKLISNKQTVITYGSHFWKHFSCISVRYDREITLALSTLPFQTGYAYQRVPLQIFVRQN